MTDQHEPGAGPARLHAIVPTAPGEVGPLRLEVHATWRSTDGDLHVVLRDFYAPGTEGHPPGDESADEPDDEAASD
jgi:hypothetical protein